MYHHDSDQDNNALSYVPVITMDSRADEASKNDLFRTKVGGTISAQDIYKMA